jgi:hypothetical protein
MATGFLLLKSNKKHSSIEDVISDKQIKFSSNLQDEAAEKCQI